jgi:hypothetical protein
MSSTVTTISDGAFYGCTNLTNLVVPESVTMIGISSFENCTNLTNVDIASSVTSIGTSAFQSCTSLSNLLLKRYGSLGYTTLGNNSFLNTNGINSTNYSHLTTIYINGYTEANLLSAGFNADAVTNAVAASCFNEDTKILCFNPESNTELYIPIQNLKKGDLVKTYLHGYRKVDVMCKGKLKNNTKYFTTCMYKMRKTETNDLTEDLIVIGGHSLLVDELTKEERSITDSIWGSPLKIDGKYLLLAGISDKFELMEGNDVYTYYHFCVENDGNDETRYGIWANGTLVETPCKKDILEFRNVIYV